MRKILILASISALAAAAQAETLLGASWSGATYTMDSTTGNVTLLNGATGFTSYNSMAYHGGTFYSVSGSTLVSIDPTTGAGTAVVGLSSSDIRGLASHNGRLYGTLQGSTDSLVVINTGTGAVTTIGSMGFTGIQGLASNGSTLYAWDIGRGLGTVDTGSGLATMLGGPGTGNIQAIEFLSDGSMVGGRDVLYSIDTTTGNFALIGGSGSSDIRGLAVVPEPGTMIALGAGLAALAARRRRK